MTPIILISFLISLTLIDYRDSARRSHYHAEPGHGASRMPKWLHRIIYKYQRYQYEVPIPVDEQGRPISSTSASTGRVAVGGEDQQQGGRPELLRRSSHDHYHSKQRKLMKMEAEEAFEIRSTVLVVLAVLSLVVLWGLWKVVGWVLVFFGVGRR